MPKTDVRVFPTRHFLINVPVFFCRNSETSCGPKRILNGLTIRNVFLEREREREKLRLYSYPFFLNFIALSNLYVSPETNSLFV